MSSHRPDVSRLFQLFGLDPSEYAHFEDKRLCTVVATGSAVPAVAGATGGRIASDPVARSAQLRAQFLQSSSN